MLRSASVSSRRLFAIYPRFYAAINTLAPALTPARSGGSFVCHGAMVGRRGRRVCRPAARRSSERCSIPPEGGYSVEGSRARRSRCAVPARRLFPCTNPRGPECIWRETYRQRQRTRGRCEHTHLVADLFPTDRCPNAERLRTVLPLGARGTTASRRAAVMRLFRQCDVPLVVLDEAQHLMGLPGGRSHAHAQQSGVMKNPVDRSGATRILVGTYDLHLLIAPNGQLARRSFQAARLHVRRRSVVLCPHLRSACPSTPVCGAEPDP